MRASRDGATAGSAAVGSTTAVPTTAEGVRSRRMPVGALLLAASALLLTACANGLQSPPVEGPGAPGDVIAIDPADVDCPAELAGAWGLVEPGAEPVETAEPVRLPAGFEAVAALRCVQRWDGVEASGAMRVEFALERSEGGLDALLAALAEPDIPPAENQACTADMELVPPLWLVRPDGAAVRIAYPHDACGKTLPGTKAALERLEIVETRVFADAWPEGREDPPLDVVPPEQFELIPVVPPGLLPGGPLEQLPAPPDRR